MMTSTNSHEQDLWTPLSPIEYALNQLLKADEATIQEVFALEGKSVLLHINGLNAEIYLTFRYGKLSLSLDRPVNKIDGTEVKIDVRLAGNIKDFIALAKNQRAGESVSAGQVDIQGDLATAQRVQNLFRTLNIDIEEIVAKATNDAFAYRLGRIASKGASIIRDGLRGLEQDVGHYVLHEKQLTPSSKELDDFSDNVDDVVLRLDRFESRLRQLVKKRTSDDKITSSLTTSIGNSGNTE